MKKTTTHPPPSRLKGGPQLPKSLRKYIRKEKARIRREVLDFKEQEKLISELYKKFFKPSKTTSTKFSERKPDIAKRVEVALLGKNYENKRDIQTGDK